jgi:proteasome lid subunit RPN8/RPN11
VFDLSENQERVLRVYAQEHHPYEACGYIDGDGIIHQLPNVHDGDRTERFACDIDDFDAVNAIWHSHPKGTIGPSEYDLDFIKVLKSIGCTWGYVIVTREGVYTYDLAAIPT